MFDSDFLGWLRENSWMQIADSEFNRHENFEPKILLSSSPSGYEILEFKLIRTSSKHMDGLDIRLVYGKPWVTADDHKGWSTTGLKFQINQL